MTPEGKIKAKANRALARIPNLYRFMPVQMGLGAPALDYYGCAGGWFFAIETKRKGKKLTARQELTKKTIEDAGGVVFVVDDDDTLAACVRELSALARRGYFREQASVGPADARTQPVRGHGERASP